MLGRESDESELELGWRDDMEWMAQKEGDKIGRKGKKLSQDGRELSD